MLDWTSVVLAAGVVVASAGLGGCRREAAPVQDEEPQVALEELDEVAARKLVARCAEAPAIGVKLVRREVEGGLASIVADVPAENGEAERVLVSYDLSADQLRALTWRDRMVFGQPEEVSEAEAQKVARKMFGRWFPEVAARMVEQETKKLHRPVFVVRWEGETEQGVSTGDRVVVQVSSATGLPIAYDQYVARQRPDADEIEITRVQARVIARRTLRKTRNDVDSLELEAELILGSPLHPQGGPVWRVSWLEPDGTEGPEVIVIDAMGGQELSSEQASGED